MKSLSKQSNKKRAKMALNRSTEFKGVIAQFLYVVTTIFTYFHIYI